MIPLLQSKRRTTKFERLLWLGVGMISLLPLFAVLSENPADLLTDFRMGFFVFFAGIAAIGWLLNWGPVVPTSILGIAILTLFTDPISSSHEEALFKDLGVPLIGATLGALIGLLIDWNLTHPPQSESSSDEHGHCESNEIAT
jgi:hypothetical protein